MIDINNFVLNTDICSICNKGEIIPVDHEGILVCNNDKCGKHFPYLIENEKPSYKEPPKEVCFYAYKRINHFREILEEKLCNLFMEIQAPYAKYCPDGRVNFLNYYYTISKLCELLNEKQFLPFFPVLKDREKRIEQDDIWKKICKELGWNFVPTL